MTCANCGAPTTFDRPREVFVCSYCRSEHVPPADEDGVQVLAETKLGCPACAKMLDEATIEHQDILYCQACHGMLIPMAGFTRLISALRTYRTRPGGALAAREPGEEHVRQCPRCSQAMDNHPYGGPGNVVIDTCETCEENWLDKRELQKIVAAPDYSYGALSYDAPNAAAANER